MSRSSTTFTATGGEATIQSIVPFELRNRGYFYRPGDEAHPLPGELRADEDGIRVDLDGTWQGLAALMQLDAAYPVIHGVLRDSKRVTLFDVRQDQASLGGYPRESWWVGSAVAGALLPDDLTFDQINLRLDHLADWYGKTGLRVEVEQDGPRSVRITNVPAGEERADLDDGAQIAIGFGAYWQRQPHHQAITERLYVVARCRTPIAARQLVTEYLVPFRDLVTLATTVPAVVDEVNLRTPLHTLVLREETHELDVSYLHRLLQPEPALRQAGPLRPDRMLFQLDDWPGSFNELIKSWWQLRTEAAPALNLLLGLSYAPPRWSDTVALTWAQAIEAYHRIRFKGTASVLRAQERHERVIASCSKDDRDWLRVRLEHADEPSLARRISDVATRVRAIVAPVLTQRKRFAGRLSSIRNTYAHFGAVEEATGASAAELYDLAQVAQWVLLANVLLDLGFARSKVTELVNRNEYFRGLVENPGPVTNG